MRCQHPEGEKRMFKKFLGILGAVTLTTFAVLSIISPSAHAQVSQLSYSFACGTTASVGYAHCDALRIIRTSQGLQPAASAPSGLSPTNLQSAYKLPSSSAGSGQTVAIVDAYDDPNAASDLAVYRSEFGLSACTTANGCFKKVNESGGTSYPSS